MKSLKTKYYADKIEGCGTNQKALFNIINSLQNKRKEMALPSSGSINELPDIFNKFFITKISQIRQKLDSDSCTDMTLTGISDIKSSDISLDTFRPATEEEVFKIISKSPKKWCASDPIPSGFLIDILPTLLPVITKIINISLETETVPRSMKKVIVSPLLKKPKLDKDVLKNYRPVSNLSFISKILEKIVSSRLLDHTESYNLGEPLQSAFKHHHGTETALLKIQSDLLLAMDDHKASLVVFLDLSAAFVTIDHTILFNRLRNDYGLCGKALDLYILKTITLNTQNWILVFLRVQSWDLYFSVIIQNLLEP